MTALVIGEGEDDEWRKLFAGRTDWKRVDEFLDELGPVITSDPALWADLKDLMQRAATVGLPYDKGDDQRGFKWPMERARNALGHLKMDEGNDQHRIYFSAPTEEATALLALLYGPKRREDPDWFLVQNEHIDEADRRYSVWRNRIACERVKI